MTHQEMIEFCDAVVLALFDMQRPCHPSAIDLSRIAGSNSAAVKAMRELRDASWSELRNEELHGTRPYYDD